MFAAVSDIVWQALIAAFVTLALAVLQILQKKWADDRAERMRAEAKAEAAKQAFDNELRGQLAAAKVAELKRNLESATAKTTNKLEAIGGAAAETVAKIGDLTEMAELNQKTTDEVHDLVNSGKLAQLKISAVALRRVAELTKHRDDIVAADLAEKLYREQSANQQALGAKEKEKRQ